MNKATLFIVPAVILSASFWLHQPQQNSAQPAAQQDTAQQEIIAETVLDHYRSPGKPGTAIAHLKEAVFQQDTLTPQTIKLQLESGLSEGKLVVKLGAERGLTLSEGNTFILDLSQKPLPPIDLTVTAQNYGKYFVNLVVQHQIDNQILQGRALAAEVQFGVTPIENLYAKTTAKASTGFKVLPVQEVIR